MKAVPSVPEQAKAEDRVLQLAGTGRCATGAHSLKGPREADC